MRCSNDRALRSRPPRCSHTCSIPVLSRRCIGEVTHNWCCTPVSLVRHTRRFGVQHTPMFGMRAACASGAGAVLGVAPHRPHSRPPFRPRFLSPWDTHTTRGAVRVSRAAPAPGGQHLPRAAVGCTHQQMVTRSCDCVPHLGARRRVHCSRVSRDACQRVPHRGSEEPRACRAGVSRESHSVG
jgi:hypothetical protein